MQYLLFTDLDQPNRMDEKPFLQIDLADLDPATVPELEKMTKSAFNLDSILSAAEELKYVGGLKRVLAAQFHEPDEDWVRVLASRVYEGTFTQRVREQFALLVRKASTQFLSDQVNQRLKTALGPRDFTPSDGAAPAATDAPVDVPSPNGIETTAEEREGFHIVRAIACSEVPVPRITARDTKSYFGILLDDNNRKPIARLHFNAATKYLGLLDAQKNETRHKLNELEDIYDYADDIRATVRLWL